jgi:NADPH:quinone reductase-like Zn-dependent oxidoreductase
MNMTRRRKWLVGVFGTLLLSLGAGAIWLSHEEPCASSARVSSEDSHSENSMKAVLQRCYGSAELLSIEDVARPVPGPGQLLVKVRAASLNPLDWHYMRGEPYLVRLEAGIGLPKDPTFGVDFSGVVESVGPQVSHFHVGDAVFGARSGALAQYVLVREDRNVVVKPANVSFEQAAALPVAAVTALQALRNKAKMQSGQKVLVNGASGGVGTYAVQIARLLGASVTGVCSGRNAELVRSLGADRVIDYTREDFTRSTEKYDVIIDNVGSHGLLEYRRVLAPDGVVVIVGGPSDNRWIGPMTNFLKAPLLSLFVSQRVETILTDIKPEDLRQLATWMQDGKLVSVIGRQFSFAQTAQAITYLEQGRARGKVIVLVDPG